MALKVITGIQKVSIKVSGVVVGKIDNLDLYVWDIIQTPDPLQVLKGLLAKNTTSTQLGTKFSEFNYSDWISEFVQTIKKMLPAGLSVIGLYFPDLSQVRDKVNRIIHKLKDDIFIVIADTQSYGVRNKLINDVLLTIKQADLYSNSIRVTVLLPLNQFIVLPCEQASFEEMLDSMISKT